MRVKWNELQKFVRVTHWSIFIDPTYDIMMHVPTCCMRIGTICLDDAWWISLASMWMIWACNDKRHAWKGIICKKLWMNTKQ